MTMRGKVAAQLTVVDLPGLIQANTNRLKFVGGMDLLALLRPRVSIGNAFTRGPSGQSDGIYPTPGRGCDCGSGFAHQKRRNRQRRVLDESKLLQGSTAVSLAKWDSLKASQSSAGDSARSVMEGGESG